MTFTRFAWSVAGAAGELETTRPNATTRQDPQLARTIRQNNSADKGTIRRFIMAPFNPWESRYQSDVATTVKRRSADHLILTRVLFARLPSTITSRSTSPLPANIRVNSTLI